MCYKGYPRVNHSYVVGLYPYFYCGRGFFFGYGCQGTSESSK